MNDEVKNPTKVYVMTHMYVAIGSFDYEGDHVIGVYTTRRRAQKACAEAGHYDSTDVQRVKVNE